MNSPPSAAEPEFHESRTPVGSLEVLTQIWDARGQHSLARLSSSTGPVSSLDGRCSPVLLLHGLGGNSITWHGVAPALARGLRTKVMAVDLPGFGATRPDARALSVSRLVAVTRALLDAHSAKDERWIVAGNSLGGVLALRLALESPERVSAVSLAAHALPIAWGRRPRALLALAALIPELTPVLGRRLIARYMTRTGLPGVVDEPIAALFANPARLAPELRERLLSVSGYRLTWADDAARAYEQVLRDLSQVLLFKAAADVRRVRCPVQAIYGTADPLFPLPCWQHLRRVRPDWRYVALDGVGHVPQLEAPLAVTEHLLAWIASLDGLLDLMAPPERFW